MTESRELAGKNGIFATRFLEVLKERGKTQKWVAEQTHTKGQSISQYANGKVLPNIEMLYEIAKCLEVSADYLLGLTDSQCPDINDREMSDRLGLTSGSVKFLRDEVKLLLEKTNRSTIKEALDVQQKVLEFLTVHHTQIEFDAFVKEMNLPQETSICHSGYEVLLLLGRTPTFKTINTLIEDARLFPAQLPEEYCCVSILEALEATFKEESIDPDVRYYIAKVDTKENRASYWRDAKGSYFRSGESVYSLRLLDLQSAMRAHRVKMKLRASLEDKRKRNGDDEE